MNTGGVAGQGGGGPTYQNHLFEAGDWPPEPAELRDWEMAERRQHSWDMRPHHFRDTRDTRKAREWMMAGGRHVTGEPVYDQWRQSRHAHTGGHNRVSTTQYKVSRL